MNTLPLHHQFNIAVEIIKLRLHLRQNPQDSHRLAIEHFQDYLEVVERYKKLEAENKELKSPSLPPIPTPSHGQLQRKYDELLKAYQELRKHHKNLVEENDALLVLLENDSNLFSSQNKGQIR